MHSPFGCPVPLQRWKRVAFGKVLDLVGLCKLPPALVTWEVGQGPTSQALSPESPSLGQDTPCLAFLPSLLSVGSSPCVK